jgi:hypothetical protein
MIQETAVYVNEDIGTSPYTGDNLKIANKIISGLNYAYMKICKEKWKPFIRETVTLGADGTIDLTGLDETFNGIRNLQDASDTEIAFRYVDNTTLEVAQGKENDTVYLTYFYVPAELSGSTLTGKIVLPEGVVNNRVLCFYSAYQYLTIENDSYAGYWLNLFNDGFDNISQSRGEVVQVKKETEMGW